MSCILRSLTHTIQVQIVGVGIAGGIISDPNMMPLSVKNVDRRRRPDGGCGDIDDKLNRRISGPSMELKLVVSLIRSKKCLPVCACSLLFVPELDSPCSSTDVILHIQASILLGCI